MRVVKTFQRTQQSADELFAHFCTQKRAASVVLQHTRMYVSAGLSDAFTALSFLSRMFP